MADETPQDPNKIDIQLSLLGGQSGVDFANFVTQLGALKDSIRSLSTDIQQQLQAAQNLASDNRGYSGQFGAGQRTPGYQYTSTGATSSSSGRAAQVRGLEDSGQIPPSEANTQELPPVPDVEARRSLGGIGRFFAQQRPEGANPNSIFSVGGREYPGEELKPLHYGQYTSQDLLYAGARNAYRTADVFGVPGAQTAGKILEGAGQASPYMTMARQYLGRLESQGIYGYTAGPKSLEQLGVQYGANPNQGPLGSGNLTIPGTNVGFRMPFLNNAAVQGMQQEFERFKASAATAGVNQEQAKFVFDQIQQQGFKTPGATGRLRDAMIGLAQQAPGVGLNPEAYTAMEQATRTGATSVQQFAQTLKNANDVVANTNFTYSQFLSDMNNLSKFTQERGGLYAQGGTLANMFTGSTGLSPQILQSLLGNPFVQAKIATQTGLPPQMQGIAPPESQIGGAMSAVSQMASALSPSLKSYQVPIPGAPGKHDIVGKNDQLRAYLHMFFPELDPNAINAILNPKTQKQMQQGTTLMGEMHAMVHGGSQTSDKDLLHQLGVLDQGNSKQAHKDLGDINKAAKGKTGADAASARYNAAQAIVDRQTGQNLDQTNPANQQSLTVDLGPNARHAGFGLFYKNQTASNNKNAANAGQSSVNVPYNNAPTTPPMFGPGGMPSFGNSGGSATVNPQGI